MRCAANYLDRIRGERARHPRFELRMIEHGDVLMDCGCRVLDDVGAESRDVA